MLLIFFDLFGTFIPFSVLYYLFICLFVTVFFSWISLHFFCLYLNILTCFILSLYLIFCIQLVIIFFLSLLNSVNIVSTSLILNFSLSFYSHTSFLIIFVFLYFKWYLYLFPFFIFAYIIFCFYERLLLGKHNISVIIILFVINIIYNFDNKKISTK